MGALSTSYALSNKRGYPEVVSQNIRRPHFGGTNAFSSFLFKPKESLITLRLKERKECEKKVYNIECCTCSPWSLSSSVCGLNLMFVVVLEISKIKERTPLGFV